VREPDLFRQIISGRRKTAPALFLRGILSAAEVPYKVVVGIRNRRFDRGLADVARVPVPVICIGNLTLGGTGKSPMVRWLAGWLEQRNLHPAIVSRGYRARRGRENDEARELRMYLPDVPHIQNPDRVAAARKAVDDYGCRTIVLDDGFQHRRLARDLDVVLLDALEPFGYEHVFPRGLLREPIEGLARAHVVALSRADAVDAATRDAVRTRVARLAPGAIWLELSHVPRKAVDRFGGEMSLEHGARQTVAAFCGVGNPAGFRHTLASCRWPVAAFRAFPDHYEYEPAEIARLAKWAVDCGADALVCTHKDLVKIPPEVVCDVPLWAVAIDMEILSGKAELESRLVAVTGLGGE
jgi:tetraacyldisaccharide 4'-kinase